MKLVSPNEMLQAARDVMLEGREPASRDDWARIMNFMACNIHAPAALSACKLFRMMYNIPLSNDEITAIVNFQLEKKSEVMT